MVRFLSRLHPCMRHAQGMTNILSSGAALSLVLLTACGGGGESSAPQPSVAVAAPAPSPARGPAPTPSPAPAPLTSLERLRASLANGAAPEVREAVVTVRAADETSLANAAVVAFDDPRVRLLGGRHVTPASYPGEVLRAPAAVTAGPGYAYGLNTGIEFVLPAGQAVFEIVALDAGNRSPMLIEIDGFLTSAAGYPVGLRGLGGFRYVRVELPVSVAARMITVHTPGHPFGGLRLPPGETLGSPRSTVDDASIVFQGDSITEGTGARSAFAAWPNQAARRLGVRNPIAVGVGGSGYLAHQPGFFTIPERLDDVLRAVNGGPPDMLVVAAGINDCAPDAATLNRVGRASLDYFRAVRAGAPQMLIVVLGPFNGPIDSYPAFLAACRDVIFSSARKVSGTYTVDVGTWVTAANRVEVFGTVPDGPHPIDFGHALYGRLGADAIRTIIEGADSKARRPRRLAVAAAF